VSSAEARVVPEAHVPLAPLSTLGVGGAARWLLRVADAREIAAAHRWSQDRGAPMFVLGGGSNLVVSDAGFDGLVVQMQIAGVQMASDDGDTLVTAAAGEPWDLLVRNQSGVEWSLRQVQLVDVVAIDRLGDRRLASPDPHLVPSVGQQVRQGRSPASGADDRDSHGAAW